MTRKTRTTKDVPGGAAAAFLAEARPGDALEAMLVAQMAAVDEAAQRCLARAEECSAEHPQIEALYLRQAARLLHLFQRQADALDRRRIAAEDRAETRERSEWLEAQSQREEEDRARRLGLPVPPPAPRSPCVWPAWPAPAEGADGGETGAKGRSGRPNGSGRRNGAAAPPREATAAR